MQVGAIYTDGTASSAVGTSAPVRNQLPPANTAFSDALKSAERQGPAPALVSAHRTPLSTSEVQHAITNAWTKQFGSPPGAETVAVLTAQWSHETGNGRSMFNYNFGGIKGVGPSGLTVNQRTREGYGATERTIRDQFRAYQSATEGAEDYLSLLARKYPSALNAAQSGDPAAFVHELREGGYFTGDESAYVASVQHRTRQLLAQGQDGPKTATSSVDSAQSTAPILRELRSAQIHPVLSNETRDTTEGASRTALAMTLQNFDDAISRAALSLALRPDRREQDHI